MILKEQAGGVGTVIASLLGLERSLRARAKASARQKKAVRSERKYFENQCERMDCAAYIAKGLPIGSGVVEAACKTLATQRMKRSGMSWGDGKQAVLTIRSLQQSGRYVGGFLDGPASEALWMPFGGIAWSNGTLYVTDSGNERIRALATGVVSTLAGSGAAGGADGAGAAASFSVPSGIAALPDGRLVIVDEGDSTVRIVQP